VFVSRASVLTQPQRELQQAWIEGLAGWDFAPVMLRREDYVPSPWGALRHSVATAHGAVILGFRQGRVEKAQWRPGTQEERRLDGWLATPWNQIEGGLALMAGLPVLVAPEEGVEEGVFAPDAWTGEARGAPIDVWASRNPAAHPSLQAWALAVRRRADSESRYSESTFGDGAPRTRT
jgi:hypothetical protein